MAAELLVALGLVAANGFFVASEFAIARLRPTQVAEFVRQRRPGARSAQHAVDHIDSYLSACQLGITLASLGLGAVGEPAFHDLLEPLLGDSAQIVGFGLASAIAFLVITVLHVVLGELAPKSAAIAKTGPLALALAPPMRAFYLATKPLVDGFNGLGNLVLKPFGIPPASEAGHAPHSEEELRDLLRESREGGLIDREEQQLSEAALVFGDRRAREVMTPRSEIDFATTDDDPLDEHGTVVGLITLEDILEEIVGEIEDEFDPRARELIRPEDGGLRIDGTAPLRLVADQLGMDIDAPHEATIGGHVAERLGRLPEPDEVIVINGIQLRVLAVDDTRVTALQA